VTASEVSLLPFSQGRLIAPWHDVNWYVGAESLDKGIASIEACCKVKWIEDYVTVVLRASKPTTSERQATMRSVILTMAGNQAPATTPALPTYEYIAYFAMQILTAEQYLKILDRDPSQFVDERESIESMSPDEAIQTLHELATAAEPRPRNDFYEIGYPAKFIKFTEMLDFEVHEIRRYGKFARNTLLEDDVILAELSGETGFTGQRLKRTVKVANRAQMASLRSDIANCLDQNEAWKYQVLRVLDDVEKQYPNAEIHVSVFNPATGILTLFFSTSREDGPLFLPEYSITVCDPAPVRMYYGGLQEDGYPLTLRQLLNKYYEGELWGLLVTMTWGGRESRDTEIVQDLGLGYRSFRCDKEGESRRFFYLRDDRWQPSDPIDIFKLFAEYVHKNEKLVQQIVTKLGSRSDGGMVDGTSVEQLLDEKADIKRGKKQKRFFIGAPEECNLCSGPLSEEKYMIDGKLRSHSAWACMCGDCFGFEGAGIGWGVGQLYRREKDAWLLVAGFPPDNIEEE
jgi:hypothetical protein